MEPLPGCRLDPGRERPPRGASLVLYSCQHERSPVPFQGGVLIGKGDDAARVLLFPDAPVHSVSVSGVYASGLTFFETVEL